MIHYNDFLDNNKYAILYIKLCSSDVTLLESIFALVSFHKLMTDNKNGYLKC